MKYILKLIGITFLIPLIVSCSSDNEPLPDTPVEEEEIDDPVKEEERRAPLVEIVLDESEAICVSNINEFGAKMWDALVVNSELGNRNIIFSPLSIEMMLGMLANGADGATLAQIQGIICGENVADDCLNSINALNKRLIDEIPQVDANAAFGIANGMWYSETFPVSDAFTAIVESYYEGVVANYIAGSQEGKSTINQWISDHSMGLIPEFFESAPNEELILANVCAFKSKWRFPFDENNTKDEMFTNASGEKSEVKMMIHGTLTEWYTTGAADIISLSYGNSGFVMDLFLPKDENSDFSGIMDLSNMSKPVTKEVTLKMPRFKYDIGINLNELFTDAGYDRITGKESDYSKLSPSVRNLVMKQKAMIDVDENGTSAAAATVSMIAGTMDSFEKADFFLNRPFAFAIREKTTGVILFMGRVCNL